MEYSKEPSEVQFGNKYAYDEFDRLTGMRYDAETTDRYAYQCHQLKDATTLKAPKGRHKIGPLSRRIHAQIGARILGDSAN